MTHVVEEESIGAALAAIWQRARPAVLARLESIEKAAAAISAGSLSAEERAAAEGECHKLAGIAGTLGFPKTTTCAREAETLLEGTDALDASQIARLHELVRLCRADVGVAPEHSLKPSARSLRVLVADDDPVNRMIVTMLLRKQGHTVVAVENGRDAVLAAGRGGFDVALMDVQMPEMDGHEATAAIRRAEGTTGGHLPILALSAGLQSANRDACMAAGADAYLTKPISASDLFAKIESFVNEPVASS